MDLLENLLELGGGPGGLEGGLATSVVVTQSCSLGWGKEGVGPCAVNGDAYERTRVLEDGEGRREERVRGEAICEAGVARGIRVWPQYSWQNVRSKCDNSASFSRVVTPRSMP